MVVILDKKLRREIERDVKKKDSYATPQWLLDVFENWFDPCTLYSKFDGLAMEWENKTYVNPPYSNPLPWVEKAIQESQKGKTIVMLLRVDTSTKWFAKLIEAQAEILWFSRRLKFINKNSANFPSMLVILNKSKEKK